MRSSSVYDYRVINKTHMSDFVDLDQLLEDLAKDPEFIAEVDANNAMWDEEAAASMEMTVDEFHKWLAIDKTQPIDIIQNERMCNAS